MSSDERALAELVDRDLPWPTQMEFVAARDRVLDQLRATAEHQVPRVPEVPEVPGVLYRGSVVRVAAAAALVIVAVGGAIIWPRGGVRVYAAGNDGLQVTLADNSSVEMRAHAEMAVARTTNGIQIDLKTGDIIVTAAKRRREHLSVRTKDMTVAVNGTAFLASDSHQGSRVAVIEGDVRVSETGVEPRRAVAEDITWSRHADAHLAVLASFQKSIIDTAGRREPLKQTSPTAQSAAAATTSPRFEEASVRPCDPDNLPANVPGSRAGGGANSFYMTPGHTSALCMTVATLIRTAYQYAPVEAELDGMTTDPNAPARFRGTLGDGNVAGLGVEDGRRVRGGPDWVRTERYTVEAVADGPADAATMAGPMLRALLEQRFKLKAHVESEQVPAFALVVAPGGLKIKPAEPNSCLPVPQRSGGAFRGGGAAFAAGGPRIAPYLGRPYGTSVGPTLAGVGRGEKRWCGQALERNGPNRVFVAGGATFSELAQLLGMRFLGPVRVYDKTGITGAFDWILEFTPEEDHFGPPARGAFAGEPSSAPPAPTAFVALEQQLGLRLEPAQAPRPFVVIDAIERPGPN